MFSWHPGREMKKFLLPRGPCHQGHHWQVIHEWDERNQAVQVTRCTVSVNICQSMQGLQSRVLVSWKGQQAPKTLVWPFWLTRAREGLWLTFLSCWRWRPEVSLALCLWWQKNMCYAIHRFTCHPWRPFHLGQTWTWGRNVNPRLAGLLFLEISLFPRHSRNTTHQGTQKAPEIYFSFE